MKKTIIAAAVAASVAAPAAFAEVSISGQMNQEFSSFGNAAGTTDYGLAGDQNVDITLTASEDLGNGMKAAVKINMNIDNATNNSTTASNAANTPTGEDMVISLSGDFGTIMTGNIESFTEGKLSAMMALDPVDSMSIEDGRGETGRTEGGIAYVSPSFNGLTVGVGAYALNGGNYQNSDFDATDFYVSYSNAGLTVSASQETVTSAIGAKDKETTMYGVEYKMGDLTARVVSREVDNNNTAAATATDSTIASSYENYDSMYYGVKYAMGANAVSLERINEGKTGAVDATVISLNHAMSKTTNVYAGYKSSDSDAEDQATVGVQVKF
jgi:predicted porin